MREFKTVDELNKAFMSGGFKLDSTVVIEGVTWTLYDSSPISIVESLNGKQPMALYTDGSNNKRVLLFAWHVNSRNAVLPSGAAVIESRDSPIVNDEEQIIIEMNGDKITIRPDQLVGDVVRVSFTGLSNPKELQGKIDTGATVSSLHAEKYDIKGNQISFVCPPLSPNTITVPLKTQHAVKSPDGGTVYRPVIELDVKVNGKLLHGALFNLNDRSHMDQPVLIGQNVLQAGKFYVDPSQKESVSKVDWDMLQENTVVIPMLYRNQNDEVLSEFYNYMLDSDITFQDFVRHIRREVIETFEDTE